MAVVIVGMVLTAGSNPGIRIELDTKSVEPGLTAGVAAPLFLFCLAGATARHTPAADALGNALPAVLIAVGVGSAIGLIGAVTLGWSWRRHWSEPSALRLGVLALPVM